MSLFHQKMAPHQIWFESLPPRNCFGETNPPPAIGGYRAHIYLLYRCDRVLHRFLASALHDKHVQDMRQDERGKPRRAFPEFVVDHLHTTFGLHNIVNAMAASLKESVVRLAPEQSRVALFAQIGGFMSRDTYTPRLADFVINALTMLIPTDTLESVLEHYAEGRCFITTDDALEVVDKVFPPCSDNDMYVAVDLRGRPQAAHSVVPRYHSYPDHKVPLWVDALPLASDVRAALLKHIRGNAVDEADEKVRVVTQCATKWDLDKFVRLLVVIWKKMDAIYITELKGVFDYFFDADQKRAMAAYQAGSNPFGLAVDVVPATRGGAGRYLTPRSDSSGDSKSGGHDDEDARALLQDNKFGPYLKHSLEKARSDETMTMLRARHRHQHAQEADSDDGMSVERLARRAGAQAFLASLSGAGRRVARQRRRVVDELVDKGLRWAKERAGKVPVRVYGDSAKRVEAFAFLRYAARVAKRAAAKTAAMWKQHYAPPSTRAPTMERKPSVKRLRSMRTALRSPRQEMHPGQLPGISMSTFLNLVSHVLPRDTRVMAQLPNEFLRLLFRQVGSAPPACGGLLQHANAVCLCNSIATAPQAAATVHGHTCPPAASPARKKATAPT